MSEPEQPAGAGAPAGGGAEYPQFPDPQQPWMPPAAPAGAGGMPPPIPPTAQVPGPTPSGPPSGRPPKSRKWQLIAATVVVLAIAGAVGGYFATRSNKSSSASAQNASATANGSSGTSGPSGSVGPRRRFRGVAGTIAAINGNTITLNTQTGVAKVQTTASTKVTVASSGSVSEIATGDQVVAVGTKSGTTIAADNISDVGKNTQGGPFGGTVRRFRQRTGRFRNGNGGPGAPGGPGGSSTNGRSFAAGTVTAVNGSTLTIKAPNGTTDTVTTTSSTNVTITKAGALSDLKPGDQITAIGNTSNGVTTATRIAEGQAGFGFGGRVFGGGGGFGGPPGGDEGGANGSGGN